MERQYQQRGPIQPKKRRTETSPLYTPGKQLDDPPPTTAAEIKELVSRLDDFTMDELREVPVLRPGTRLEQGATYVNVADRKRQEFTALGGMVADREQFLVPKRQTPPPYWNRIIRAHPRSRRQ